MYGYKFYDGFLLFFICRTQAEIFNSQYDWEMVKIFNNALEFAAKNCQKRIPKLLNLFVLVPHFIKGDSKFFERAITIGGEDVIPRLLNLGFYLLSWGFCFFEIIQEVF
jgi:hypothetical protein